MAEDRALTCLDDLISILGVPLDESESHKYYFEVFRRSLAVNRRSPRHEAAVPHRRRPQSADQWLLTVPLVRECSASA